VDLTRPVVLVGLMASGKTSVATRLAAALERPVRDSDQDLRRRCEAGAAELVGLHGAGVLHAREAALLREALADRPAPVVAAAASVVEDPACREALAEAYVVWLDAPPEVLAARVAAAVDRHHPGRDHRPRYQPDLLAMLTAQRRRRAGWYRQVADLVVDADRNPPEQVAEAILADLAGRTAAG
jgi:shikimate kinase